MKSSAKPGLPKSPSPTDQARRVRTSDFTTHQVVLDASGGGFQALPGGINGPVIERPVLTLLLRPDGAVAVHQEAEDFANEVRKDIKSNYDHELAQSDKERKNSVGAGMSGMMGRMSGMMGGSMGGMMRGGN